MPDIQKNEGKIDRITRIGVGISLLLFGFFFAAGIAKPITLFIGSTTIISAILGWCPLYIPFGIDTCHGNHKKKKEKRLKFPQKVPTRHNQPTKR